jgi:hypothetical protein
MQKYISAQLLLHWRLEAERKKRKKKDTSGKDRVARLASKLQHAL